MKYIKNYKIFENYNQSDITDILNQISEFMESNDRNKWVGNSSINLYIRKSKRIYNKILIDFFDFASIEVYNKGKGFFTKIIKEFELKYPNRNIFIESILTDRFSDYIENKLGFHKIDDLNNLYKIKTPLLNENLKSTEINIYDAAWLYFLCNVYEGKMKIDSWSFNKQMKNTTCVISLSKFDCVIKKDGFYISNDRCEEIVDQWFGSKTFKESLIKGTSLIKYDNKKGYTGYTISDIPNRIYLEKNPSLQKSFDRIDDRIVDHFNSHGTYTKIVDKLGKSRNIKEYNFDSFYRVFPDLPNTIKVYRGIKNEYDESRNEKGYSSWTYSKKEAERFAKHYFSGGMQFEPIYTENPYILETEISFNDIVVMVLDHGESEIILKNPVDIQSSYRVEKTN